MASKVEEQPDTRSLYVKLQEQKAIKEEAFNEANKFSNLIRRLDDTEIDFLASVSERKEAEELKRKREKDEALARFRKEQRKFDTKEVVPSRVEPTSRPKKVLNLGIKKQKTTKNTVLGIDYSSD